MKPGPLKLGVRKGEDEERPIATIDGAEMAVVTRLAGAEIPVEATLTGADAKAGWTMAGLTSDVVTACAVASG